MCGKKSMLSLFAFLTRSRQLDIQQKKWVRLDHNGESSEVLAYVDNWGSVIEGNILESICYNIDTLANDLGGLRSTYNSLNSARHTKTTRLPDNVSRVSLKTPLQYYDTIQLFRGSRQSTGITRKKREFQTVIR